MFENRSVSLDILLATYNGELYLEEQIDSILAQSFEDFKLIIADDCSQDSTRQILIKYAQKDSRIHLIFHTKNVGVIRNFEHLISISSANYFMLCDQDDVWYENKVYDSIQKINVTQSDLIYSDLMVVDSSLNVIEKSFWRSQKISPINKYLWEVTMFQNIVTGCTIIANSKMKKYILPFPEKIFMHDWWISFSTSIFGKVEYIDNPLINYRQHENNIVGARVAIGSEKTKKINLKDFIQIRNDFYSQQIEVLQSCRDRLSCINDSRTHKVVSHISQVIERYTFFRSIRFFSLRFILFKHTNPSQGFFRNIWWTVYNNIPIGAYLLRRIKRS